MVALCSRNPPPETITWAHRTLAADRPPVNSMTRSNDCHDFQILRFVSHLSAVLYIWKAEFRSRHRARIWTNNTNCKSACSVKLAWKHIDTKQQHDTSPLMRFEKMNQLWLISLCVYTWMQCYNMSGAVCISWYAATRNTAQHEIVDMCTFGHWNSEVDTLHRTVRLRSKHRNPWSWSWVFSVVSVRWTRVFCCRQGL